MTTLRLHRGGFCPIWTQSGAKGVLDFGLAQRNSDIGCVSLQLQPAAVLVYSIGIMSATTVFLALRKLSLARAGQG